MENNHETGALICIKTKTIMQKNITVEQIVVQYINKKTEYLLRIQELK